MCRFLRENPGKHASAKGVNAGRGSGEMPENVPEKSSTTGEGAAGTSGVTHMDSERNREADSEFCSSTWGWVWRRMIGIAT